MNVLVFCSDTFRYDHLGVLGLQPVLTPNLDQLAKESASFENFRLCSFPTVLNRIEVFTGRYTFPVTGWGPLPFHFPVLAEVFKHHGFTTGLIADNPHMMKEGFGFGRGFDYVKDVPGQTDDDFRPESEPMIDLPCAPEKLEPRKRRLERYRRSAYWYRQQRTNTTETVCRDAIRWLANAPSRFFLWVDAFDPHEPWDAPKRFLEKYPWDPKGEEVIWPRDGESKVYPEADIANMRSLYRAEISQVDFWIGEIMEQLRRLKLLENTVVIFCSDHGYYFDEHGLIGKLFKRETGPNRIYEELGHVPLFIRHPEGHAAGRSLPGFCQPTDIFPTVLELAGIPVVQWAQGNSLLPRLRGEPGRQQFAVGGCHPHARNQSHITVWSDEWTLVYSPTNGLAGSELFHRLTDPTDRKNVISNNSAVATGHLEMLTSWLEGLGLSPARRNDLLQPHQLGWRFKMRQRLRSFNNRFTYWRKYRDYAIRKARTA